jgi:hypothetical protein
VSKNPSLPEYWYARAVTEQEVWGMLLAHNLIRREATKAAEKHKKRRQKSVLSSRSSLSQQR